MRTRALCHIRDDTGSHHGRSRHRPAADRCREAGNRQPLEPRQEQPTATIVKASDPTEAQKKEFIIGDNAGSGDWDTDALANQWNTDLLKDWGFKTGSCKGG